MTKGEKRDIKKICQQFAQEFKETIGGINGSGWLIVGPLSAYLNACDFENTIKQLPECGEHPQVLSIIFKDGSKFIPAGADLKAIDPKSKNWMWL